MDEVEKLIEQLKSEVAEIMIYAAVQLGQIKDKRAVPYLIEALEDEISGVRIEAAVALRKIRNVSAVPALIERLKDENGDVRWEAAYALGEIGDTSAVPALIERLKDEDGDVRWCAGGALGLIGVTDEQLGKIIGMLESEKANEREEALIVLVMIGDFSAVPVLIKYLRDEKAGRWVWELEIFVENCRTRENLERLDGMLGEFLTTLREERVEGTLIDFQIQLAKLTRKIAKKKDELTPKRDLLLDDRPKLPKKGRGVYHTTRMVRNG